MNEYTTCDKQFTPRIMWGHLTRVATDMDTNKPICFWAHNPLLTRTPEEQYNENKANGWFDSIILIEEEG